MKIYVKRIYDPPAPEDGTRILVDRLWPRGLSKSSADIDAWLKELAPSNELRRWFGHDPKKWAEFQRRYFAELKALPDLHEKLAQIKGPRAVTLLFGARDLEHNNAVALKIFLEKNPVKKASHG